MPRHEWIDSGVHYAAYEEIVDGVVIHHLTYSDGSEWLRWGDPATAKEILRLARLAAKP